VAVAEENSVMLYASMSHAEAVRDLLKKYKEKRKAPLFIPPHPVHSSTPAAHL
jgi:hypothetical protein